MARGIRNSLGAILVICLIIACAMNLLGPTSGPICMAGKAACASFPPPTIHPPIITFIETLPILSTALLVLSLLACGIGYLLLYRNRAPVAGVILAYAPFITLVVVGFLAIPLFLLP